MDLEVLNPFSWNICTSIRVELALTINVTTIHIIPSPIHSPKVFSPK